MKRIWGVLAVFSLVIMLLFGQGAQEVSAKLPSMAKKAALKEGKTKRLKVKGKYIKTCRFTSTKKSVATVNAKGKITAKKAGKCKIKAVVLYKKNKKAKKYVKKTLCCHLTVKAKTVVKTDEEEPALYTAPDDFVKQGAEFSINLAKRSIGMAGEGENVLISPESVMSALALTLEGAAGDTKEQIRKNLCGLDVAEFHKRMSEYHSYLTASKNVKFHQANSIWMRNDGQLSVKDDYLQRINEYYGLSVFRSAFDAGTVKEINRWVDENTAHMIPNVISEIEPETVMYLMNALSFEGEWDKQYKGSGIKTGETFTNSQGKTERVTMLEGRETSYVEDENAVGFVKPYKGGRYAFVGLLPKSGKTPGEYINGLSGQAFLELLNTRSNQYVYTKMPEFSYDYSTSLVEPMKAMGITDLFDGSRADLSALASYQNGNLFVSDVIHKTHIDLDRNGTRAAAITVEEMKATSAAVPDNPKQVYLDRPFLYVIIDTNSHLPIFIGTVNSVASV